MYAREELLKQIIRTISTWRYEIELRGDINLYDSHIIAQYHVKHLLNAAYGYQLEDLDDETRNQVGIDLGDYSNQIAFQVTATRRRSKIEETIGKFIDNRLYEQFHELYFFILSAKLAHRKGFDTRGLFEFNIKEHILDFGDLIQKIKTLETPRLLEIVEFLEQETSISEQVDEHVLQIALKYYPRTYLGTSFLVRLTNRGQRPITLMDVFLNLESGGQVSYVELSAQYIQLSVPLPQTLQETEFSEFLFPLCFMNELKREEITSPLDVASVEVVDSLEQKHRFPANTAKPQREFSQLREEIQKHWEKEDWLSNKTG